ncbi:MAG: 50S ribosomal protein L14e [Nanoarchaeota archaeon]
MLEVGRLVVKTCGRDAMEYGVIIEVNDDKFVTIDGNVRRKKVNKFHVEPLNKTLDVKKGADTKTVLAAFEKAGIPVKKSTEPKKAKKVSEKPVKKKVLNAQKPKTEKKTKSKSKKE